MISSTYFNLIKLILRQLYFCKNYCKMWFNIFFVSSILYPSCRTISSMILIVFKEIFPLWECSYCVKWNDIRFVWFVWDFLFVIFKFFSSFSIFSVFMVVGFIIVAHANGMIHMFVCMSVQWSVYPSVCQSVWPSSGGMIVCVEVPPPLILQSGSLFFWRKTDCLIQSSDSASYIDYAVIPRLGMIYDNDTGNVDVCLYSSSSSK